MNKFFILLNGNSKSHCQKCRSNQKLNNVNRERLSVGRKQTNTCFFFYYYYFPVEINAAVCKHETSHSKQHTENNTESKTAVYCLILTQKKLGKLCGGNAEWKVKEKKKGLELQKRKLFTL